MEHASAEKMKWQQEKQQRAASAIDWILCDGRKYYYTPLCATHIPGVVQKSIREWYMSCSTLNAEVLMIDEERKIKHNHNHYDENKCAAKRVVLCKLQTLWCAMRATFVDWLFVFHIYTYREHSASTICVVVVVLYCVVLYTCRNTRRHRIT